MKEAENFSEVLKSPFKEALRRVLESCIPEDVKKRILEEYNAAMREMKEMEEGTPEAWYPGDDCD